MRSRSGAIHCESEDDFITLAEATHNTTAIFYDQRSHRALRQRLAHKPLLPSTKHDLCLPQSVTPPQDPRSLRFSDFDYAVEDLAVQDEMAEMEKGRKDGVQTHITITTRDSQGVMGWLWSCLGVQGWALEKGRRLELVVESNGYGVYKFWVLSGAQNTHNQVIDIYLRHSPLQLKLDLDQRTYSLLRGNLIEIQGSQVISRLLNDWKQQP